MSRWRKRQRRARAKPSKFFYPCPRDIADPGSDNRHRKSEKEEDEELLKEGNEEDEAMVFEESPSCKSLIASSGSKLRVQM